MTLEEAAAVPKLLTYVQAQEILPVGLTTLRDLVRRRELPSVAVGRRVFIEAADLARFIEGRRRG
ncbi:MAG TPA: helix-turn-helix domain-containing protein [Candidatus Dormibacteraeota bacterium]|nr:helix-turn-helix domain-containing protein [Candidatus Dormibacteraeota bacterium]